jgi:hypothetical protein
VVYNIVDGSCCSVVRIYGEYEHAIQGEIRSECRSVRAHK